MFVLKKFGNKSVIVLFKKALISALLLVGTLFGTSSLFFNFNNLENDYQLFDSRSGYIPEGDSISGAEFVQEVESSANGGDINYQLDKNVNLADFGNHTLITDYVDIDTFDNEYAIHNYDDVVIDFNGYTVYNKNINFIEKDFDVVKSNLLTPYSYYQDETETSDEKEGDWEYYNDSTDTTSLYYLYLFYDIDNLTIKNGNFVNVPFVAYDINNLTIENSSFYDVTLSNVYFGNSRDNNSNQTVRNGSFSIGLVADQISNLTINNVSVSKYKASQNVYNYEEVAASGLAHAELGLFTRVGYDISSKININNLSVQNIEFNQNERGVQDNENGLINVGIISSIKGELTLSNFYANDISFVNNNDLNFKNTTQNSLISFVMEDTGPSSIQGSINSIENIFVGDIYNSKPDYTFVFGTSFDYDDTKYSVSEVETNGFVPTAVSEVSAYKNEITFIEYNDDEAKAKIIDSGFTSSLIFLNSFNDESADTNNIGITSEESINYSFYKDNFDDDYFYYDDNSFPKPITYFIIDNIDINNSWKTIGVKTTLKNGFYQNNNSISYTIKIINNENNEVVATEQFKVNKEGDLKYTKPFYKRTDQYSYQVFINDDINQSLVSVTKLSMTPFPVGLIIVILIIFILLILIILLILLFFFKRSDSKEIALVEENNELSLQLYEFKYDFNKIDEYYEILGLKNGASFKKVQNVYNNKVVQLSKEKIAREEFDNVHVAYMAIEQYLTKEVQ